MALVPVASYAAYAVQIGLIDSIFRFSREMEQEADTGLVPLMTRADYDPHEAPRIWEQLRDEQDATAAARKKRSWKDDNGGLFATHPPTRERVTALRSLAEAWPMPATATDGRVAYYAAMRPWYPAMIDEQIKLNDFGASEILLTNLGRDGWTPELLYVRGELYRTRGRPEELTAAGGYYREAIAAGSAPAEAWRGLGLTSLRSGQTEAGRAALKDYLAKKPDLAGRPMLAMLAGSAMRRNRSQRNSRGPDLRRAWPQRWSRARRSPTR